MRRSLFIAITAVLFATAVTFTSCSDEDDEGLHFTVYPEQITEGAITVKNVHTYVGYYSGVDVRGYKGEVKAVSADESIATVDVLTSTTSKQSTEGYSLCIKGKGEGTTIIAATDGAGRTAKLTVTVSKLMSVQYRRVNDSEDNVVVEGASEEETAAIRNDVLDSPVYGDTYLLKQVPSSLNFDGYQLLIYKNVSGNQTEITTWFGGLYNSGATDATNSYRLYKDADIKGNENYTDFIFDVDDRGGCIKILLTDEYKATYPSVTKVMLVVAVTTEQGEYVKI